MFGINVLKSRGDTSSCKALPSSTRLPAPHLTLAPLSLSPVADVAGAVLVGGAAGASPDAVHVLVALGRVLGKVDAGAEHAPDVGVPLVEALVDDGVDERRACRKRGKEKMIKKEK